MAEVWWRKGNSHLKCGLVLVWEKRGIRQGEVGKTSVQLPRRREAEPWEGDNPIPQSVANSGMCTWVGDPSDGIHPVPDGIVCEEMPVPG